MSRPVATLEGVVKEFRDVGSASSWRDIVTRRARRPSPVVALRGVDLRIDEGEAVAVVGGNGAGKTTLLRLLAGVLVVDGGAVAVRGEVGSLLELGAGFHPELTGRETAVLAGVIDGYSRRDAAARVESITTFAGLEQFIDRPLRTYSSGMRARLAFAVAVERQPAVLLVDEVLAVGDVAFQQQCVARLQEFHATGTTLVMVSHEPDLLRVLCDRAVWLDGGVVVADGPADDVLDRYVGAQRPPAVLRPSDVGERALQDIQVSTGPGRPADAIVAGAGLTVRVALSPQPEASQLAVRVIREDDMLCVDTSTPIPVGQTGATLHLARLDLAPGRYRLEVGLYEPGWQHAIDLRREACLLRVLGTAGAGAALAPPAMWQAGVQPVEERTDRS